jgi:hypothetical protein
MSRPLPLGALKGGAAPYFFGSGSMSSPNRSSCPMSALETHRLSGRRRALDGDGHTLEATGEPQNLPTSAAPKLPRVKSGAIETLALPSPSFGARTVVGAARP